MERRSAPRSQRRRSMRRRGKRTTSVHLVEKNDSPLLNSLDAEGRRDSIFNVLVVAGSGVVLLAVVAVGVLIWTLPTKDRTR